MDGGRVEERGIVDCVLVCEFSNLKNMKNETLLYLWHQPFSNVRISYLKDSRDTD